MNETTDWDDYRLFLAVARGRGLAAAAQSTGKSAPTLGRRMVALERRLGRSLFTRHARGYDLTAEGAALMSELDRVDARLAPLAGPSAARVRPVVKVSAGTWMTRLLCQHADQITADGRAQLQFISAEHVLDIRHRETLIGVRNHRPTQDGLAGRRVGQVQFAVYGTDASVTTWAVVDAQTPSARWTAKAAGPDRIALTHPRNALDLAEAGLARAVLPTVIGDPIPGLRRLSDPIAALTHDQWLVSHAEERFEPAVRQVIRRIETVIRDLQPVAGAGADTSP